MEKLTSLTKENFWNYLMAKDPVQMKKFCEWIDKYKKEIHWNNFFKALPGSGGNVGFKYPKYHDMPIAIQLGIFIQFCFEQRINATIFLGDTGALIDSMDKIPKAISMCLHDWMPHQQGIIEENSIDDATEGMAFI